MVPSEDLEKLEKMLTPQTEVISEEDFIEYYYKLIYLKLEEVKLLNNMINKLTRGFNEAMSGVGNYTMGSSLTEDKVKGELTFYYKKQIHIKYPGDFGYDVMTYVNTDLNPWALPENQSDDLKLFLRLNK